MIIGYNLEGNIECLECVKGFINDTFNGNEDDFLDYVEVNECAIDISDLKDNGNTKGYGHIECVSCKKTIN
ncbi:hypothetical protein CIL05_07090 [Virgibacillus profundi]|uniref:Uncharacterized protein n=1 Tax=Virgibacillus profundi TaxID=2024555 RepID=A0A2A2IGG7_9BACI|nr:hypothetical protein [Virgibacillus profundi]PAV30225.1 hypothetical protein CIL05_07090 [Virgibacillus profundi]PXY54397.1 hypothetical protein CIT14_07175 [Virgibacillus profundi]